MGEETGVAAFQKLEADQLVHGQTAAAFDGGDLVQLGIQKFGRVRPVNDGVDFWEAEFEELAEILGEGGFPRFVEAVGGKRGIGQAGILTERRLPDKTNRTSDRSVGLQTKLPLAKLAEQFRQRLRGGQFHQHIKL